MPSHYSNQCWNIVNWLLLGTNFNEILIETHTFSFKKIHFKMLSGKRQPFRLWFNVLRTGFQSENCYLGPLDPYTIFNMVSTNPNMSSLHTVMALTLQIKRALWSPELIKWGPREFLGTKTHGPLSGWNTVRMPYRRGRNLISQRSVIFYNCLFGLQQRHYQRDNIVVHWCG